MDKKCTLFLSSYDKGEDLWEGFFTALSIQWPEMDMPIVLNTETKNYSFPGYSINAFHPCKNRNLTWAERIVYVLSRVETEYVLFFLEDYWLDERVDDGFFKKVLGWMDNNLDVANFSFYPCLPGSNIQDDRFDRFELRPQKCEYKFNCQVGLWRTRELIHCFRKHEDPWEWEMYGSIRAGRLRKKFYSLKDDSKRVFSYGDNLTGCIVHRGKWVRDAVVPLADKYGLSIDYSKRGFEDFDSFWKDYNLSLLGKIKKGGIGGAKRQMYRWYRMWLSTRKKRNKARA